MLLVRGMNIGIWDGYPSLKEIKKRNYKLSKSRHPDIRALLKQHEDGLTANEISELLKLNRDSVKNALNTMPDVYIDRWLEARQGLREQSVWCVANIPENCPKPNRKT